MSPKTAAMVLMAGALTLRAAAPETTQPQLEHQFTDTIHPFLESYCFKCHSGEKPKAQLDLSHYANLDAVVADYPRWSLVLDKLAAKDMPPENAKAQPEDAARQAVVAWISAVRRNEAVKHAGDPGIVLARRLSNAEYNYTIRDLTGVDIQPAREFPVDPANQAGFDNSGESLDMSPALMTKYLQAARDVANHLVLKLDGIDFASYPMLVETDRDKYCISQIVDFYHRQDTDYADYFFTAWQFKHRQALGKPKATLADFAAANRVSAKYLDTIRRTLEEKEKLGPIAKLQSMWRELPEPKGNQPELARDGCAKMRDYVVALRAKLELRFPNLVAKGVSASSQPFLMWKNRQYATHRRDFEHGALQVEGEAPAAPHELTPEEKTASANEFGPGYVQPVKNRPGDPDLFVPKGERAKYEAAFAKFCSVFPDNFYIQERGRNYLDKTKDRGRLLSAGFHNVMGYFRDDQPLCELVLDDAQQKQLDTMWRELDFIALGLNRTYVQFYFNESGEARGTTRESEGPRPADKDVTSEALIQQVKQAYLNKLQASSNQTALRAIEDHFKYVNDTIRWVERAKADTEPVHLAALEKFAAHAYRRPLSAAERDDLHAYYRSLRQDAGLGHEDAMRDLVVYVLMSPDFCYRIDLADENSNPSSSRGNQAQTEIRKGQSLLTSAATSGKVGVRPLSDFALASRLSYFLWSSAPDDELLAHAAAGDLHRPEVIAAQARRMLKDERSRALAVEFGGNWLDFRRFEELNTVDRERFTTFDNDLREAMFEEPIRFMLGVFRDNRSVLDFLYADYTFVNPALAKHYGMPALNVASNEWVRVDHAGQFGRGGILPMAVFLTKNAPGLRTSPVKRGYWVVRRVLGEQIPPPPAVVPELPRDEAKLDLPLRDVLVRHRADPSCAACHARFDSLGLVFEGYGPVGERRDKDLAGHDVDTHATFPGGSEATGFEGARQYVRAHRQDDFVDNLSRKLLAYALNRTLMLSDDITIEDLHGKLARDGYRFDTLIENIVTSPQFLNKRNATDVAQN